MSYIAPNNTIYFYKDIPIDNDYQNTLYFVNEGAQRNYFSAANDKILFTVDKSQYTKKERGYIHVNIPYSYTYINSLSQPVTNYPNPYELSYMSWINTGTITVGGVTEERFENKMIYAFVTSVDYVNNNTWKIGFEVDPIQSFVFGNNFSLKSCYVERQHSTTDIAGDNIIREPINISNYETMSNTGFFENGYDIIWGVTGSIEKGAVIAFDDRLPSGQQLTATIRFAGGDYGDIFLGNWNATHFYVIDGNALGAIDRGSANAFLSYLMQQTTVGTSTVIQGTWLVPHNLFPTETAKNYKGENIFGPPAQPDPDVTYPELIKVISATPNDFTVLSTGRSMEITDFRNGNTLSTDNWSHTVRNKKLFTFPFTKICVTDGCGSEQSYQPEFFEYTSAQTIRFGCALSVNAEPQVQVVPLEYAGQNEAWDKSVKLTNFSTVNYNYDAYTEWVNSQGMTVVLSTVAQALIATLTGGVGTALPRGATALASGGTGILSTMYEKYREPDNVVAGKMSTIPESYGRSKMRVITQCAPKNIIEEVDDYFTRYGYAQEKLMVPNLRARKRWTYIKTHDCQIEANLPSDIISSIREKFDKGITFWNINEAGTIVGDYTQTNDVW